MSPSPFRRDGPERQHAASWLGLLWTYSGLIWLGGLVLMVTQGLPVGALAMGVRLAATLALGIGLAAAERWAWAAGVCLSALYGVLGLLAAAGLFLLRLSRPGAVPPWAPMGWGFTAEMCRVGTAVAAATAAASVVTLLVLWRSQSEFAVPERRPFGTLLNLGAAPASLVALTDSFLVFGWWLLRQ